MKKLCWTISGDTLKRDLSSCIALIQPVHEGLLLGQK